MWCGLLISLLMPIGVSVSTFTLSAYVGKHSRDGYGEAYDSCWNYQTNCPFTFHTSQCLWQLSVLVVGVIFISSPGVALVWECAWLDIPCPWSHPYCRYLGSCTYLWTYPISPWIMCHCYPVPEICKLWSFTYVSYETFIVLGYDLCHANIHCLAQQGGR